MKVSIITIVRNAEHYIERTVKSVLAQTHPDIEYVVVDGASTDRTLERIEPHRDRIASLVSESDRGISDAWNKGLSRVTGDVIGLLNAGDEYAPTAAAEAVAAIGQGADLVFGDTELVDDEGRLIRLNRGRFHTWFYSAGFGFYHPSCFFTRELHQRVGGFSLDYRYAMDSDWIARAIRSGAAIRHAGVRARMVDGGVSVQRRYAAYGEHLHAMKAAGFDDTVVFRSMLMTGLRGMARRIVSRLPS